MYKSTVFVFLCVCCITLHGVEVLGESDYQTIAVDKHNEYRANHHSPPLELDETLNANALKCAQYYAQKRFIDHTCPYKNGAGENLIGGPGRWTPEQFAVISSDSWYNEGKRYNYNRPGFSMGTGHFTQLVWKSSTKFGFGVVNGNGYTAGVGLYNPPGNYLGQFPQNVLKP